ncbi:putative cysteine-rich receptor-like protein kinase 39 [Nymphaea thermarum]|nr:putative cysteine-rich receptor-like protein kinase 39 [Nymphaea thermarum]
MHNTLNTSGIKCTVISNVTEDWTSDNSRSLNGTAFVGYNSTTGTLSSLLRYRNDTLPLSRTLDINLTTVLPETVVIGFSAATGKCLEAHRIKAWSFSAAVPAPAITPTTATSPSPTPDTAPKLPQIKAVMLQKIVVILMAGLIPLFIVVVVIILILLRMRKKETDAPADGGMNVDEIDGPADGRMNVDAGPRELAAATNGFSADGRMNVDTGPREFTYTELAAATDDFSDELGKGGFGIVYKGTFKDTNTVVAVKRFSQGSKQGKKEYEAEVTVISRLRHRNLVKLIGWCHEGREFLLVYEYMEGGSLDSHLFSSEGCPVLSWARRMKVVVGLARAVHYLHEECEQYIVHRDIKLTNVMVDAEFNARLGDFGLARVVDHGLSPRTTENVVGTKGYWAPEYVFKGKASRQSDVYSFGVVLLEITTGQKATKPRGDQSLVEWIWELYGRRTLMEAADQRLNSRFDRRQMQRTMEVGLWCVHTDPRSRPTMRKAIGWLTFETEVPSLPRTKPPWDPQPSMCELNATFFACSSNETGHRDVDPPSAASTSSFVGPATIDQQRQTADHSFREDAC